MHGCCQEHHSDAVIAAAEGKSHRYSLNCNGKPTSRPGLRVLGEQAPLSHVQFEPWFSKSALESAPAKKAYEALAVASICNECSGRAEGQKAGERPEMAGRRGLCCYDCMIRACM